MSSIDIFPWNENFNTGILIIDEQHQKLAQLLNQLASHIANQVELPELDRIFYELTDYTVYHFDTEETFWHDNLAEDSIEAGHKEVHDSFITTIQKLKAEEHSQPAEKTIEDILSFLTRWLASHILETDRYMALVVQAIQSGLSLESAKKQAQDKINGTMRILIDIILSTYANHVTNTLHLMKEIADRRQAEISRIQKEKYQRALLDTFPYAVWLKDIDSNFISVNKGFARIFGAKDADDLVGKNDFDIAPQELAESYRADDQAVRESRQKKCVEEKILTDGAIKWFETHKSPVVDNNGNLLGTVGFACDITERKLADESLRDSETRFRTVIEESPIGIGFSRDGITIDVNSVYLQIFGFENNSEVIGHALIEQIAPQCRGNVSNRIGQRICGNQINSSYETTGLRKDGSQFPLFISAKRIELKDGPLTFGFLIDMSQRKESEEKIRQLAFYDSLTNLPNRELLRDRLQQALSSSDRSGHAGALLFMDLDNFKTINDTLGHAVGDLLLKDVAERLKSCVHEGDTVARLGGDEFVVILEDLSTQVFEAATQTEEIGETILSVLNRPYLLGNKEFHNSPSIGVTLFTGHQQGIDDLFKQADLAMYQAKKDGRNTLRFFDPQMQHSINVRSSLEAALRKAITHRQFLLNYQIQVDHLLNPVGAEALIRWLHPERGLVSPVEFIPIAEDTGLILPIGKWVLETACAQLKAWQKNDRTRKLTLSVNVSAKQFHETGFVPYIQSIIQHYAINPELLKLEPTESLLLEDIEDTIKTMNLLKSMGIRFALDDFGTGFSSLQYLKKLPLSQLKIDQSFTRDLVSDSSDQAIVRTIIAMAQSLNLEVIAEGVETEEQKSILQRNGCNHYQGYLFGRPQPIEVFEETLKKW